MNGAPAQQRLYFGLRSPKVLFDTNAVRDFFRESAVPPEKLPALRDRVIGLAADGDVRFIMTQPVSGELANILVDEDPSTARALFDKTTQFYVNATRGWTIRPEHERVYSEIKFGRKLLDSEAFYKQAWPEVLLQFRDEQWVERKARILNDSKAKERREEAEKRLRTVQEMEKKSAHWREVLAHEFSDANWTKTIRKNVRIEMTKFGIATRGRITQADLLRAKPDAMQTLWFSESFYAVKALEIFVESKKALTSKKSIDWMPDLVDVTSFRDAAYADVFVTSDKSLLTLARRTRLPLQVLTLAEFADAFFA